MLITRLKLSINIFIILTLVLILKNEKINEELTFSCPNAYFFEVLFNRNKKLSF